MNQHTFVKERLAFYEKHGLTPEPGGEWQEAHYPDPRDVGSKTIWMLHNDHQQQGLYQSEEYQRPCFYNADVLKFLTHGPFVPGWFDLWDLYDKWKGGNSRKNGPANLAAMHAHDNTKKARVDNLAKVPKGTRASNGRNTCDPKNPGGINNPNHPAYHDRNRRNGERALKSQGKKVLITYVETGVSEVYPSIRSAAKKLGLLQGGLTNMLNPNHPLKTYKGYTGTKIDE